MHLLKKAQIAYLKADKAFTKISSEYANFRNIFSLKLVIKLLKNIEINNHVIKLIDDWQFSYTPIYNLSLVKLKILKIYIKNNLANGFIRPFKSPIKVFIFFDKRPNRSLKLCVDY